jgi:hypothetical protein
MAYPLGLRRGLADPVPLSCSRFVGRNERSVVPKGRLIM